MVLRPERQPGWRGAVVPVQCMCARALWWWLLACRWTCGWCGSSCRASLAAAASRAPRCARAAASRTGRDALPVHALALRPSVIAECGAPRRKCPLRGAQALQALERAERVWDAVVRATLHPQGLGDAFVPPSSSPAAAHTSAPPPPPSQQPPSPKQQQQQQPVDAHVDGAGSSGRAGGGASEWERQGAEEERAGAGARLPSAAALAALQEDMRLVWGLLTPHRCAAAGATPPTRADRPPACLARCAVGPRAPHAAACASPSAQPA